MPRLLVALVVFALTAIAAAQPTNCKFTFTSSSNTYDLSKAYTGSDYITSPDKNNQIYHFSICHNTQQQCGTLPSTPICQTSGGTQYSCGQLAGPVNSWEELENKSGIIAAYTGGYNGRTGDITMVCGCEDPGVSVGTPIESPTKDYHIYFRSKWACPNGKVPSNCGSSSGSSTGKTTTAAGSTTGGHHRGGSSFDYGWIFIIILGASLVIYVLAGFAVNRFYLEKTGLEQIPNYSFWRDLPSLVWEGFLFCYRSVRRLFGDRHESF